MLQQQLKTTKKVKYEIENFCEQFGFPPIVHSKKKGKNLIYKDSDKFYKFKKYKSKKHNDFYKTKFVYKKHFIQNPIKRKCFNCGEYVILVKTVLENLVG